MTEKKTVLHAWRTQALHPLPRTDGARIEANTGVGPYKQLVYDVAWGGRGGWFDEKGRAVDARTIFQWRPYVVIQPKKEDV